MSTPPPGSARPLADKALETLSSSSADKLRELFPGENSQTVQQVYDGCSDVASAGRNVATDDTISPKLFNVKLTGASRSNPGGRAGCDFALIWTAGKRWEISIGHTSTSTAG